MPRWIRHRRRWLLAILVAGALAAIPAMMLASNVVTAIYFTQTAERAENTLGLAVSALQGQLDRYKKLPELLAEHQDIIALVSSPADRQSIDEMNRYLKATNDLLEASDIYIMAPDGTTIAASNYDLDATFIGENFAYRPYFFDAIVGGMGSFFALGTTSLKRGYYFSAPIHTESGIGGVLALKVDIDAIERTWRGSDYEIVVTDPEGIIFMSGRTEWLFSAIQPLTEDRLARTAETRRYADAELVELPVSIEDTPQGHRLFAIADEVSPREYLTVSQQMPDADWTVKVFVDAASARAQAMTTVALGVLVIGFAIMGAIVWMQRRAQLAERLALQREAHEQLERRVVERTADLATVNLRLKDEILERRNTEQKLRKTQSDLVQAGKLAALGQMSAALSHEFNQPLAAVRSYADSALVLIDRDRTGDVRQYVERIGGLAERMTTISRHLSNFARKPGEKLGPVLIETVIADAMAILEWRIRADAVALTLDLGKDPITVRAGQVRLQQVLVNILSNALDAIEDRERRAITITARRRNGKAILSVHDNGPGIAPGIIARIFDPFFSTKGVGRGLGLGLSISYNIIKDFGGDLTIANAPEGGAVFSIVLELADVPVLEPAQ